MEDQNKSNQKKDKKNISRRDVLKSLATVPVVGAVAYGALKKKQYDHYLNSKIAEELGMSYSEPENKPAKMGGKEIRIGIIGYGIRGKQLTQGLGFVHPSKVDSWKEGAMNNKDDKRYSNFIAQDDLNVRITAVCDIFDTYGTMAQEMAANVNREGNGGKMADLPKRFLNHKDLIASPDVDAVIIAAPDHWHGPMTIEAAKAGKHVYCEKPLTWTVEETYEVRKAVKENNVVFQLGHQGRQTDSYNKAKEAIEKGVLGPVNLIEVTTNRNSPNGAWVYPIHKDANQNTIDWEQFIGQAPWHDFNLERFFRWRCWWDYSTGLSGDLLTHEYDAINQIMNIGIPDSAMSTGGIYYYKDGRTVPDVLTTVFEFPERDLSMIYSATLSSEMSRGKRVMGHDAYMELGNTITIFPDSRSTRYADKINEEIINPSQPIYSYIPGKKNVDAITSATESYFANRGLLYTYRGGKRVDTTHLHLKEWIDCIRSGEETSCNIDQGFEEAITAHMGTLAYHHKKQIFWDAENEKIIV
ncbi:MAG: Gfo/Idh/MocA family oxidoreductase [Prolixibacteraceae bacterium]|jgi:predicted dehydrogenase|nr:Gfo/Idh/MocA family oxidoreductase [Prolixibacteraceae bacterium]MBT6007289.1 Gfo/Idh/MocA family oxidoreductase [Prolixibacteraceae bacterium]MBT6765146.1 Gfo/Idh/MocA family oxidoreductase [Prolixibacteraceae bacterium]MBT6996867.1 Gfo/Idh/MocA family oxidoreductase [Prolixibacteraceae bacterium]MBT7396328.1 Gfo/Idh/MocA family oxidoreductase [Prolixibacteraceae bacterium]